jgi:hypothetical protein
MEDENNDLLQDIEHWNDRYGIEYSEYLVDKYLKEEEIKKRRILDLLKKKGKVEFNETWLNKRGYMKYENDATDEEMEDEGEGLDDFQGKSVCLGEFNEFTCAVGSDRSDKAVGFIETDKVNELK